MESGVGKPLIAVLKYPGGENVQAGSVAYFSLGWLRWFNKKVDGVALQEVGQTYSGISF